MVEQWGDLAKIRVLIKGLSLDEIRIWLKVCQDSSTVHKNYPLLHQDLVNLLGTRLGFEVQLGDYGQGPDGIWKLGKTTLVVEIKSSSHYLDLSKVDNYMRHTQASGGLAICPEFAQDRIAAVKGGYQNIRLLTTDALCKLVELKEKQNLNSENALAILVPQEMFLLDGLIELIYGIASERVISKETPKPKARAEEEIPVVTRSELTRWADGEVIICPSKPDGVEFILERDAWAFVRVTRQPRYFALYVSAPESAVKFISEIHKIVDPTSPESPLKPSEHGTYEKGKKAIIFKPGSLRRLAEPLGRGKAHPQGIWYSTLNSLARAKTLDDLE